MKLKIPEVKISDTNGYPIYEVEIPNDATIRILFIDNGLVKPFTVDVETRRQFREYYEKETKKD